MSANTETSAERNAREYPVIARGERYWDEYDVTVRWAAHDYCLDFWSREGTKQPDGSTCFMYFDESGQQQWTDDFDKGERFVDGSIKWDGCSHVSFGDETGYVHLCGGSSFAGLMAVLREAFAVAAREIPSFDAAVADAALLPPESLATVSVLPQTGRTH